MKYLIISFLFISQCIFSQSGWFWQNPLPQGNDLKDLFFVTSSTAYCINYDNILKSTDSGKTWDILYTGFKGFNSALYIYDENMGFIYLDSAYLIKTTNGGISWRIVSKPDIKLVKKIYFQNLMNGYIISDKQRFETGALLSRTTNGGRTWTPIIYTDYLILQDINFPSHDTGYIIGYTSSGNNQYNLIISKTTNAGLTWSSIPNDIKIAGKTIFFINNTTGFAGGQSSLYKTTNGGANWNILSNISPNVQKLSFFDSTLGIAIGSDYFASTTNSGHNWKYYYMYNILNNSYLSQVSFCNANTGIVVGYNGFIARTENLGANWEKINKENFLEHIYDIKFADANTGYAVSDKGTILLTHNGGTLWKPITFDPSDGFNTVSVVNKDICYLASFNNSKIYKTANSGTTWDSFSTGFYGITRIDFVNAQTGFGVCKYQRFIKTTNGGVNWTHKDVLTNSQNWALDFINDKTGYAGGSSVFHKTTDGGDTWISINLLDDFDLNDLYFLNSKTGFAAGIVYGYNSNGAIYKTTDEGTTWIKYTLNSYTGVFKLSFPTNTIGYAASTYGDKTLKTTNAGDNWVEIKTCSEYGLNNIYFTDFLTGYMAGHRGSIIKTTNGGNSIGVNEPFVPNRFFLYQNYPNPFNPITTIKIDVPEIPGTGVIHIKIIVYDLLGRLVQILADEDFSMGAYEIKFDGTNFASGIYFYQLITNDFSQSKKMILLR